MNEQRYFENSLSDFKGHIQVISELRPKIWRLFVEIHLSRMHYDGLFTPMPLVEDMFTPSPRVFLFTPVSPW
jgi:hypothetical protein